jgi:hypothetical protein
LVGIQGWELGGKGEDGMWVRKIQRESQGKKVSER